MTTLEATSNLEHLCDNVKPPISASPKISSSTMIHHKVLRLRTRGKDKIYKGYLGVPYGMSSSSKLLPISLYIKKKDTIKDSIKNILGLTEGQQEIVMELLNLQVHYGRVYPKAVQVVEGMNETPAIQSMEQWYQVSKTPRPRGHSLSTFWRTIKVLENLGLIEVVNRYLIRPHAQISNLYKLDNLVRLIAKYLAEHIGRVWPGWFHPILHLTWPEFWTSLPCEGTTCDPLLARSLT